MIHVDVEKLVELAQKAHNAEIIRYNSLHKTPHEAKTCDTCLMLAVAERKLEEAEEYQSEVVLYIP